MDDPRAIAGFLAATVIVAAVGLSPSPNFAGLVGLLVALQLYPRLFSRRLSRFMQLWAATTLGSVVSYTGAASNALQSSAVSIVVLVAVSASISIISVSVIYVDACYIGKNHRYNWRRLTIFPTLWALLWGSFSLLTPTGRLLMWSPVDGIGPYTWALSYLGPWGIDFIVAAWSVMLTEVIAAPLSQHALSMEDRNAQTDPVHFPPYADDPDVAPPRDYSVHRHKYALTGLLLVLALPSLWRETIPNPTYTTSTTPFTLGCALPRTHLSHKKPHSPSLNDYIAETRKMTNAKLVLWPEGVLKFETESDRNETFKKIFEDVLKGHKGLHVGVGFEENASGSRNKRRSRRNGFALLVDDKVVLEYYKRNLVPIAESFSMLPSEEEPTIYRLPLGPPSKTNKTDWAEPPDYTRPIPITSSICLDFSSQASFLPLDSRPALILAPARTWHPSVGLAMWNQARQRAHETGSTILWCDGGEGGLSGLIGGGFEEPLQFGEGSWTKTIGLTYPFPEKRTVFMWIGNFWAFFFLLILTGSGGSVVQVAMGLHSRGSPLPWNLVKVTQLAHGLVGFLHRERPGVAEGGGERGTIEDRGRMGASLLDLDDEQEPSHHPTTTYGAVQRA